MEYQRKKSCKQCRLSKTRCNLAKPHCQRCDRKNLPCRYEHLAINQSTGPASNEEGILYHSWVAGTRPPIPAQRTGMSQPEGDPGFDPNIRIEGLLDFDIPLDVNLDGMYTTDMQWNSDRTIQTPAAMPEKEDKREILPEKETRDDVCWFEVSSNGGSARNGSPPPRRRISISAQEGHYVNDFVFSMMKTLPSSLFEVPGVSIPQNIQFTWPVESI